MAHINYEIVAKGRKPSTKRRRRRLPIVVTLLLLMTLGAGLFFWFGPRAEGPPWVVVLDAGHGGADSGAMGIIPETELTETTVMELEKLLAADDNFRPVLTRQPGEGASVNERARQARTQRAHLMLSVHGNAAEDSGAQGFECYPVPPGRQHHEQSLQFAGALAAAMQNAGALLRGDGGIRYVYYGENGEKIFAEAGDTLVRSEPSFGVLEKSNCVAVLVEQCFVTHAGDVAAFAGAEGCRRAAQIYYEAICAYFGTQPTYT